jgi:hypothetical protein
MQCVLARSDTNGPDDYCVQGFVTGEMGFRSQVAREQS